MFSANITIPPEELILGEKFPALADYVFNHYGPAMRGDFDSAVTFYSDTEWVDYLFPLLPGNRPITLITHNGDRNITEDLAARLPANVTTWFAQNVCCAHPKVRSLPIGLENSLYFPELRKREKILAIRSANSRPSKLLYINHTVTTNASVRAKPYALLGQYDWVTAAHGQNGVHFDEYLAGISDHFYTISPEGNGVDCHRTWEILYCNRVPVMTRNFNTRFYEDLPILFVDAWEEVTEKLLRESMDRFITGRFNLEKLTFSYWRKLIHAG